MEKSQKTSSSDPSNTTLGQLRKLIKSLESRDDDVIISLGYIMLVCFPNAMKQYQKNFDEQYMKGYIAGLGEGREEKSVARD